MNKSHSFCRLCLNGCALLVDVEDGRVVHVRGDKDNPVYRGFTCVKGREQGKLLAHPARVRHSLKRQSDGSFRPIPVADALDEIACRLRTIIGEYGPDSIAGYLGTYFAASAATMPFFGAFMGAVGSAMMFSPGTLDKPGKKIAQALHGDWGAPAVGFDDPDVIMLVGANPLITFTGFPYGNPGKWLNERLDAGARLIVIDPRRSDVAKRAHIHIQPRPGTDVALLAAMLRITIDDALYDNDFVDRFTEGLNQLRQALEPFTVSYAASVAGIEEDQIAAAGHMLGGTRRGYIMAGTGPNMSGHGSLIEYLLLNLHTLNGYWLREGDRVRNPGALAADRPCRAEVRPHKSAYGFGPDLGVRGLTNTAAGMPTGALPDLMLGRGGHRIRALISVGGNPASAWPDQVKTRAGLEALDLLVQIDPWMSTTARLADYVIGPRMWLEVPGTSQVLDWLTRNGTGYGQADPYAQYSPPVVEPPAGSDVIEEWEFFYELARRLGLSLAVAPGLGPEMPAKPVNMSEKPTTDEVLSLLCEGGRIPLSDVRDVPGGGIWPGVPVFVEPGDSEERFNLAHPDMLTDLAREASGRRAEEGAGFRLICRRMMHVYNSSFIGALPSSARPYNPAFLHPDDLLQLGIEEGQAIEIATDHGTIPAVAHGDGALRRGTVSISFGFGGLPGEHDEFREIGSNPNRLLRNDQQWERYSGQPLMTNIPVDIRPLEPSA